jgi:hypothetical protein
MLMELSIIGDQLEGLALTNKMYERQLGSPKWFFIGSSHARTSTKVDCHSSVASRRHAEELITSGRVSVNGEVVKTLGAKADPKTDHIRSMAS